jgi:hypothetical protein
VGRERPSLIKATFKNEEEEEEKFRRSQAMKKVLVRNGI